MKTPKINSLKFLFHFSLIALLISTSCAQSGNKTKAEAVVDQPAMDIQTAVLSNNLVVVKQHIEAGTDINEKDQFSGATPLITAATFGKTEIVNELITAGADLTLRNNDGATALHVAAFFCQVEIVQLLLDAKADKTGTE